jgi:hypothetical protein
MSFHGHFLSQQFLKGPAVLLHDEPVRAGYSRERAFVVGPQRESVIQATRTLHDCPTAGTSTQNWHSAVAACGLVDLNSHGIAVAHYDKFGRRFPKPKCFRSRLLANIQQCLIAGQVCGRTFKGAVEEIHGFEGLAGCPSGMANRGARHSILVMTSMSNIPAISSLGFPDTVV